MENDEPKPKARGHSGPRKRRPKNRNKKKDDDGEVAISSPAPAVVVRPEEAPASPMRSKLCASAKPFSPTMSPPLRPANGSPRRQSVSPPPSLEVEAATRAYWVQWAIEAAENERARRLGLLAEIQLAEDVERLRRQSWAMQAIEAEQQSRTANMFLEAMQNTAWFQATISPSFLDYEVVCPHSWFGCSYSCMLRHVEEHLRDCPYRQVPDTTVAEPMDLDSYDIVCPNAILGCKAVCSRDAVAEHLLVCSVVRSPEAEYEERMNKREHVIQASEDERLRRMHETKPWPLSELQRLYTEQAGALQMRLHSEIVAFADYTASPVDATAVACVLTHLGSIAQLVWPNVCVEPYGSFATQLNGPSSDVDVVIGYFGDAPVPPVPPFDVQVLADVLINHGSERIVFTSIQAIPHAAIPLVKVLVELHSEDVDHVIRVPLDITFWKLHHYGLASAALSRQLCAELPGLREVTLVLKYFLSKRGMNDVYRGGLSSYGLLLMVVHVMLLNEPKAEAAPDESDAEVQRSILLWQEARGVQIGRAITSRVRCEAASPNLGKLFMDVLQYYGNDFQPEVDVVTVLSWIDQSEPWTTLYIQDPLHAPNNVGRNCYRISHILRGFNDALNYLTSLIVRGNDHKYASILDHILNGPIAPP